MGPFAATWLLVSPTSALLRIRNTELQCAMRRRLGIAVLFDSPDPHGHARLADGTGGRTHARHTELITAWRQVFREAGGMIPDKNVERVLATTHIPMPPGDLRRMDLVVTALSVAQGVPFLCDVTVVSPITRRGQARPGTSNRGGTLLEQAEHTNNTTYPEVTESGLGALECLGAEVYGRWGNQCVALIPALAREHTRDMHSRIRRGALLGYQHRWWGILGLALQKAVARGILQDVGDLPETFLSPALTGRLWRAWGCE